MSYLCPEKTYLLNNETKTTNYLLSGIADYSHDGTGTQADADDTPVTMMEKLDRGLVVIPVDEASATAKHYFASWRYLGIDDTHTTFTILKNGKPFSKATTAMTDATSAEVAGEATDRWQVVTLHDGDSTDVTPETLPWKGYYMPLKLNRPAGGNLDGKDYCYTPNDCSVGDVDGDGQYEIIVK